MKRYLQVTLFLVLFPLLGFAQGTTSGSIEGTILDEENQPLPGANVVAIHEPTGSRYGTASRSNGRYTIKNVRVGGPYVIQVTFIGYNAQKKEIPNIELGETIELNFQLEEGQMSLDEISVTAEADPIFNADRTGAQTNISTQELESTPTISRSITDFNRLIPQSSGGNSFVGQNDRYNNILIDGATLNDVFGLGEATPGSQAGAEPISLDAIEELNVDIAPYDVTNNNFTGGQLNAVTRSGTNNYEGSVYFLGRNENFVGALPVEGAPDDEFPEFGESFVGFRVGGPIIEDELFFFVNAELKRRNDPLNTGIQGSGAASVFPLGQSTFDEIKSIAMNQYGYDPGSVDLITQDQDNDKILAKLDWNINDDHKLTLRHNFVNARDDDGIGRSVESYDFSNRQYIFRSKQNSTVAELSSNLGNNIYNQARLVYTRIRDERDVQSEPFPEVTINTVDADGNDVTISMGIDRFSQANRLDQDLFEFTNNLTVINGDHELTLGTSNQLFFFENLFIQDFWGSYEFGSIQDFRDGDPSSYNYSYSKIPGTDMPIAEFSGLQFGLYAQDKWSVSDNFRLTYGLRADMPVFPDEPLYNPDVEDAFGYDTRNVASGNIMWSPRLGFNYDTELAGRLTQIRGGTGIFSGSPPYVWLSNQYSNTGADLARIDVTGNDTPQFSPDPDDQPQPGDGSGLSPISTTEVNLISDDFKFPQTWRTNLAVDHELPGNMTFTIEGIYSNAINDVVYENINLRRQSQTGPDGRPLYGTPGTFLGFLPFADFNSPDRIDPRFTNALLLKNTSKGYQYSLTGQLEKQTDFGLSGSVSYTFNEAKSVVNNTSSRAISNWQFQENFDINNPELGTSDFEVRHRILANLSYVFSFAERFQTTVSLIYEGSSGRPYSWIYFGDANGDGQAFNDLVYVPASQDEVELVGASGSDPRTDAEIWADMNAFIESQPSLREHRGEVVPRHNTRQPWRNVLDLRINQEIRTVGGQSLELTANVFNVLNLLNDEWGDIQFVQFQNETLFNFYGLNDEGKPVIAFPQNYERDSAYNLSDLASRWQLQLGVRYNF
ncbi:MAG: TonB-dependent receptor [Balneolaceae bacterium]|nr:TonB-dependent receptor [Balneolaceae bacterium]